MVKIKADLIGMAGIRASISRYLNDGVDIERELNQIYNDLDFRIKATGDIKNILLSLQKDMRQENIKLETLARNLSEAINNFQALDRSLSRQAKDMNYYADLVLLAKNFIIKAPLPLIMQDFERFRDTILSSFSVKHPSMAFAPLSVIAMALIQNSSFASKASTEFSSELLGKEISINNRSVGVNAYLGKVSSEIRTDDAYAGVNAYIGKAKENIKFDTSFIGTKTKKEFNNGEWVEKEQFSLFDLEAAAGVSFATIAGDASAGFGDDGMGMEGKLEGELLSTKVEGKGKFSVGEDGVNAYLKGEALVTAAKGKARGTINFLGLEITTEVSGYAGAAGVEGKFGVEDGKFVMKGGVAALIGGAVGIEIGFNDAGWDSFVEGVDNVRDNIVEGVNEFVDYITFWD